MERRERKPCCCDVSKENWDKWARIFSLRIASNTLPTTDVRLMGLNRFGSAVRGVFATGVTMTWRQSSGIWEVWRERLKMRESVGAIDSYVLTQGFKGFGKEPIRAISLIGVEGYEGSLGF